MAVDVLVPPVGTNTDTLVLVAWHKREGDRVVKDEPLFAVETDKSVLDIEAPATGVLRSVTAAEGAEVVALGRVAVIVADGESTPEASPAPAVAAAAPAPVPAPVRPPRREPVAVAPASRGGRIFISPRAKVLASAEGAEWEGIDGTGPEGAIVEADIRDVLEERAGRTVREVVPLDRRTAAHGGWSAAATVRADAFLSLLEGWERANLGIEAIDLALVLLLAALRRTPRMNATCDDGGATVWNEARVAVGVETDDGVRWPVLPGAEGRTPRLLAAARRAVEADVRAGTLPARSFRGATIAVRSAAHPAIVRLAPAPPPGVGAALGIGAPQARADGGRSLQLELTVDARLAAVAPVERFLADLAVAFENPIGALE